MANDIEIVRRVASKGREFYAEGVYGIADSLRECNDAGYKVLFMPELAMVRADADKNSRLWETWFVTPSVRVTGESRKGNPVVVYAHVPTSLSDPANIKKIIDDKALVNGAGPMPENEFHTLLDQEGDGRVFVVDYNKLKGSKSDVVSIGDALAHPQTIPFLGGEQNAQAYLAKHREVYGERIGVWYNDDLKDRPMGRVLFVGNNYDGGLYGSNYLYYVGRVVGVAPEAQSTERNSAPLESRV